MLWDMEGVSGLFTREQCWYWEPGARPARGGRGARAADGGRELGLRRGAGGGRGRGDRLRHPPRRGQPRRRPDAGRSPNHLPRPRRRLPGRRPALDARPRRAASTASCSRVTTPRRAPRAPSSRTRPGRRSWADFRINGRSVGEIGLESCFAGHWDIPFALVQGDAAVCAEAREQFPGVVTAEVKRAIGRDQCVGLEPAGGAPADGGEDRGGDRAHARRKARPVQADGCR